MWHWHIIGNSSIYVQRRSSTSGLRHLSLSQQPLTHTAPSPPPHSLSLSRSLSLSAECTSTSRRISNTPTATIMLTFSVTWGRCMYIYSFTNNSNLSGIQYRSTSSHLDDHLRIFHRWHTDQWLCCSPWYSDRERCTTLDWPTSWRIDNPRLKKVTVRVDVTQ